MNIGRDISQFNCYTPNHTKQSNTNHILINGHYINGFIAGNGCLFLSTSNNHFGTIHLNISQHINNRSLIESIANYFNPSIKVRLGLSKDVQIHLKSISL